MSLVTFLIGAGASAEALPLVKGFNERLSGYANENSAFYRACSSQFAGYFPPDQSQKFKDYLKFFVNNAEKLVSQLGSLTIDQYAKKKYDNGKIREYNNIKCLISAFFSLEQLHPDFLNLEFDNTNRKYIATDTNKRNIVSRYEFLWSNLANGSMVLNKNVRILSWNYDFQPELSYQDYFWEKHFGRLANPEDIPYETGNSLQIIPRFSFNYHGADTINCFSLIKLNGVAGFYHESETKKAYSTYLFGQAPVTLEIVYSILEDYFIASSTSQRKTTLKFTWERNKDFIITAMRRTKETEVLVVIGYTFQPYNRDIDKEILSNMTSLRTVYTMGCPNGIESEIKKMNSNTLVFHPYSDRTKFPMPDELAE